MPKIFLIGMPGSGKSTIAKSLAIELKRAFIDLDKEVEQVEGATIEAIFELKGEAYFRQVEAQVLTKTADKNDDFVIATGGGSPCHYSGIELMNKTGITVFINTSPKVLIERLKNDKSRPLLKEGVEESIHRLYSARKEIYLKAQVIIEANHLNKSELLTKILQALKLITKSENTSNNI